MADSRTGDRTLTYRENLIAETLLRTVFDGLPSTGNPLWCEFIKILRQASGQVEHKECDNLATHRLEAQCILDGDHHEVKNVCSECMNLVKGWALLRRSPQCQRCGGLVVVAFSPLDT